MRDEDASHTDTHTYTHPAHAKMSATPDMLADRRASRSENTALHSCHATPGRTLGLDTAFVMKSKGPPSQCCRGRGVKRRGGEGSARGIVVYSFHNGLESIFLLSCNTDIFLTSSVRIVVHLEFSSQETQIFPPKLWKENVWLKDSTFQHGCPPYIWLVPFPVLSDCSAPCSDRLHREERVQPRWCLARRAHVTPLMVPLTCCSSRKYHITDVSHRLHTHTLPHLLIQTVSVLVISAFPSPTLYTYLQSSITSCS